MVGAARRNWEKICGCFTNVPWDNIPYGKIYLVLTELTSTLLTDRTHWKIVKVKTKQKAKHENQSIKVVSSNGRVL